MATGVGQGKAYYLAPGPIGIMVYKAYSCIEAA